MVGPECRSRERSFVFVFKMTYVKSDVHVHEDNRRVRKLLKMQNDEPVSLPSEKSVCGQLENPETTACLSHTMRTTPVDTLEFPCMRIKANFNWIGQWECGH